MTLLRLGAGRPGGLLRPAGGSGTWRGWSGRCRCDPRRSGRRFRRHGWRLSDSRFRGRSWRSGRLRDRGRHRLRRRRCRNIGRRGGHVRRGWLDRLGLGRRWRGFGWCGGRRCDRRGLRFGRCRRWWPSGRSARLRCRFGSGRWSRSRLLFWFARVGPGELQ